MAARGIKYLDCYGVDNALVSLFFSFLFPFSFPAYCICNEIKVMACKQVRVADPTFLGYFIEKGVAAAAKVVRKVYSFYLFIFMGIQFIDSNVFICLIACS